MEKALQIMERNSKVDVLVCGGEKIHQGKKSIVWLPQGTRYGEKVEDAIKYGACGTGFVIRHQALSFKLIPVTTTGDMEFITNCIKNRLTVKFCRIKLFKHKISENSTIVAKRSLWLSDYHVMAKRYLSKKMYCWVIISDLLSFHPINLEVFYKQVPLLKKVFFPIRLLYQRFMTSVVFKKLNNAFSGKRQYIWDGGFS